MFYFNLPLCVIALIAVPLTFGYKGTGITLRQSIPKLDLIGSLLHASGLILLLIAVSCGGVLFSWRSAVTIVLLIFGIASFAIAYFWQSVGATEPFMRHVSIHKDIILLPVRLTFEIETLLSSYCKYSLLLYLCPRLCGKLPLSVFQASVTKNLQRCSHNSTSSLSISSPSNLHPRWPPALPCWPSFSLSFHLSYSPVLFP